MLTGMSAGWQNQKQKKHLQRKISAELGPGTGGQSAGIYYQGQRTAQANAAAKSARSFRPDLDNSIYEIYEGG